MRYQYERVMFCSPAVDCALMIDPLPGPAAVARFTPVCAVVPLTVQGTSAVVHDEKFPDSKLSVNKFAAIAMPAAIKNTAVPKSIFFISSVYCITRVRALSFIHSYDSKSSSFNFDCRTIE